MRAIRDEYKKTISGRLGELIPEFDPHAQPLEPQYRVAVGEAHVLLNDRLGQGVTLTYLNELHCLQCAKNVRKLYGGGHCYDCFATLARCDLCVMSPDRCHFHEGTCREPAWGETFCMQPHSVYLANTSGPKIGITRAGREHRRWLDQGATEAVRIIDAPTRRAAGVVEAHFSRRLNDRTDWRKMVTGVKTAADLQVLAGQLRRDNPALEDLHNVVLPREEADKLSWVDDLELTRLRYPVLRHSPAQRLKLSADDQQICDNLSGIVGQYLLFSQGVVNLADYRGSAIDIGFGPPFTPEAVGKAGDSDQLSLFD